MRFNASQLKNVVVGNKIHPTDGLVWEGVVGLLPLVVATNMGGPGGVGYTTEEVSGN